MDRTQNSVNAIERDIVRKMLFHLSDYERAPSNLIEKWQQTEQAHADSTTRTFLRVGGFPVWFSLILTQNAASAKNHYAGKSALGRLLRELESEPIEYRESIAVEIASATDPTLRNKAQKTFERLLKQCNSAEMANKRRCTCFGDQILPLSNGRQVCHF